jgi:putative DNA primase/helicase
MSMASLIGRYAKQGFLVIPLHSPLPDGSGRCTCSKPDECKSPAKHPRTKNGLKDATTDLEQIERWWTTWPAANVGICTGPDSGLVVLDVDQKGDGIGSLEKLQNDHDTLPETLIAATGGGGYHYFYRYPEDLEVGNRANLAGYTGLDVRGKGGYVVAAPSVHATGALYEWIPRADGSFPKLAPCPAWLAELMARKEEKKPAPAPKPPARVDGCSAYGARALEEECGEVGSCPEGNRNHTLNAAAFSIGQLVAGGEIDEDVARRGLMAAAARCGLPDLEADRTFRSGFESGLEQPRTAPERELGHDHRTGNRDGGSDEKPPVDPELCTDMGNARRLVHYAGEDLRHTLSHGWLVWNGKHWEKDATGFATESAKEAIRRIFAEAGAANSGSDRLRKWAVQSQAAGKVAAAMSLGASEPEVAVTFDTFDPDPFLLTVENGTLDLRTGAIRGHRREDMITKRSPVVFDPKAKCPLWMRFLDRVMDTDRDLVDLLQRAVGYALTADVSEQVWFFLYGMGANGKSTFLTTILELLGQYGRQAAPELLVSKRNETHPTEVASLAGVRLAVCTEVGPNRQLDVVKVKQMTGGDKITARYMRQDFFTFDPTFTIFLAANHRPRVNDATESTWRRLLLIPFTIEIPEEEQDKSLGLKLRSELPGILNWAIEGCLAWQREGLQVPGRVRAATAEYRSGEDIVGEFIEDRCEVGRRDHHQASAGELYAAYKEWCEEMGFRTANQKSFGMRLSERGFERARHGQRRRWYWFGLSLRPPEREGAEQQDRFDWERDL